MALLTGVFDGGPMGLFCSATHGGSALSGMTPMYLLMSAFHLAPWLKLIARPSVPTDGPNTNQRSPATSEDITAP